MNVEFKKIIKRIKEITGFKQKEMASYIFDITEGNLSVRIKRNSFDINKIITWAFDNNVDLNWLLTGRGQRYLEQNERRVTIFDNKPEAPLDRMILENLVCLHAEDKKSLLRAMIRMRNENPQKAAAMVREIMEKNEPPENDGA